MKDNLKLGLLTLLVGICFFVVGSNVCKFYKVNIIREEWRLNNDDRINKYTLYDMTDICFLCTPLDKDFKK